MTLTYTDIDLIINIVYHDIWKMTTVRVAGKIEWQRERDGETDREMKRQTDKDEETETDGQTKETPQIINL